MSKCGAVVKVGNTSKLRLRNINCHRAITFGEMSIILDKYNDISAIIIEEILPYEKEEATEIVNRAKENGTSLFVHCEYSDYEITKELGLELGLKVSETLEELQHNISSEIVECYTRWGKRSEVENNSDSVSISVDINKASRERSKSRQSMLDALENYEDKRKNVEYTSIDTRDDLLDMLGIDYISNDDSNVEDVLEEEKEKKYAELKSLLDEVTRQKNEAEEKLGYAEKKIEKLAEIKDIIQDERDKYRELSDSLQSKIDASISEEEYKQKINELHNNNAKLEQKMIEYQSEKLVTDEKLKELTESLAVSEEKLSELNLMIEDKDKTIIELSREVDINESIQIEVHTLKADKARLVENEGLLTSKIADLNRQINKIMTSNSGDLEKIQSLSDQITELNEEISELKVAKSEEVKGRLIINSLLEDAVKQNSRIAAELNEHQNDIQKYKESEKAFKTTISSKETEIAELNNRLNELETELGTAGIEKDSLERKYNSEINAIKLARDSKQAEIKQLESERNELRESLSKREEELARLLLGTRGKEAEVSRLVESNNELEETAKNLQAKVTLLQKEATELVGKLSLTEKENDRLAKQNKALKSSKGKLSKEDEGEVNIPKKVISQSRVRLDCDYTGRAIILPVFGSGSFGVTTLAMSICKSIPKSRILYMDMDLVSPKADTWFSRNPLIGDLVEIKDSLSRSSFGALLELGSSFVLKNKDRLIQSTLDTSNGSKVDYFSGLYTKVNNNKLINVNFSELMNGLGSMYNYIVVDLGTVGSSSEGDELIKMFSNIAYRNSIVSLNDDADARNLSIRLMNGQISLDNAVWLLNIATTSSVGKVVKQSLKNAVPVIMMKDMGLYGTKQSFDKVPLLKERLKEFMDELGKVRKNT